MLTQVAPGVLVHQAEFCQSNAVVVQGAEGVLLIDAGIQNHELIQLARDIQDLGQSIVAGFSTHPHWDHLLWHPDLGSAPRYGTAQCAAVIQARRADPGFGELLTRMIPPDIIDDVPLDLLGHITGLPDATTEFPWDGPSIRIIEHQAHAPGHAALFIEKQRVLIAGDLLSDVLVPLINLNGPADPIADYLTALQLLEDLRANTVIPGHGSVGGPGEARARIARDRAYLQALRDQTATDDPRIGPNATFDWVAGVHEHQAQLLARS